MEKYCRTEQATDDNVAHAHCVLDNYGYKHKLTISNTYCFAIEIIVARTSLNVTSYVHWLSCYNRGRQCLLHGTNLSIFSFLNKFGKFFTNSV